MSEGCCPALQCSPIPNTMPSIRVTSTPKEIHPYFQSFSRKNKKHATITRTTGVASINNTPARSISREIWPLTNNPVNSPVSMMKKQLNAPMRSTQRHGAIELGLPYLAHNHPCKR